MSLLSHHDFKVQGDQMLFCRIALLQAMLTSKKAVDGYSKLIVKSDFDRLSRALQAKAIVKLDGHNMHPKAHKCILFSLLLLL